MTQVFEFGAASAIGLFPVTSRTEMRGQNNVAITTGGFTRNELAQIPDSNFTGIWNAVMARLGAIPEYRQLFEAAYPGTPFSSMTFAHASNAMAGFFVDQLTFSNTPWDQFLAGDDAALTPQQFSGANMFMGTTAKCAGCHNGALFTDAKTRNVALAQFGPGEGNGPDGTRRLRTHQRDRRRHRQVRVQDAGAQKRRAHRPVRPRRAVRRRCAASSITTASRTSSWPTTT